jgi:hypothetical protein
MFMTGWDGDGGVLPDDHDDHLDPSVVDHRP